MMPAYHIGTLSPESLKELTNDSSAEEPSDPTRPVFLQTKTWSKAVLDTKTTVSPDSKIFSFRLDHVAQTIGLPVGQHLLMRLRDPASREAIIRAYTPISYGTDSGSLDILIKIYQSAPGFDGGKMTQALDAIPTGHAVDFKGPVGKFEYMGKGDCSISSKQRHVRRFIMICAGSGVTPIFQVLRAVADDPLDETKCLVLDGNRGEEDILCREELDALTAKSGGRATLVHTLTRGSDSWTGLRGRMDKAFFEKHVGQCKQADGSELVLVCGPEPLEKSVREFFVELGWRQDDLLFF